MRSRPLPLIGVLLARALLVVAVVAGLGAMHALVASPSAAGQPAPAEAGPAGTHQMVAGPVSAPAAGAELLADGAETLTTAAWSGSSHRSASDHLMGVLAACLTVLLLVGVALVRSFGRPGSQERGVARAPAGAASERRAPRIALTAVLRI